MRTLAITFVVMVAYAALSTSLRADPQVKYCKNYETGQVIVIEAGYPCPFPTVEI